MQKVIPLEPQAFAPLGHASWRPRVDAVFVAVVVAVFVGALVGVFVKVAAGVERRLMPLTQRWFEPQRLMPHRRGPGSQPHRPRPVAPGMHVPEQHANAFRPLKWTFRDGCRNGRP